MPNALVQAAAEGLPMLNRRHLLKGAVAGAVIALPVVAEAQADLTDEQQLDACVSSLRSILARMHPGASTIHPHYYSSREDGSFRFQLQGDVVFQPYQGEGTYLISMDGHIYTALVREEPVIALSGKHLGWSRYYARIRWYDDFSDEERQISPNFIRKIEG